MSNDKKNDIEDIFSKDMEEEITKELKVKRKRYNAKLIGKTIALTLAILVAVTVILNVVSGMVLKKSFVSQRSILNEEYRIMHPTEYIGESQYLKTGLFKSITLYEIGKIVEGKVLNSGTRSLVSGIQFGKVGETHLDFKEYKIDEDITKREQDTNGLRSLIFMMPYVDYDSKINDFKYLDEIDNNKYVEMVISLDKEYSYEEVNKSFDSEMISFYWVDTLDNESKDYYKENKVYMEAHKVVGIKSYNAKGEKISKESDRLNEYKQAIENLKSNGYRGFSELDENNTNVSGIVVQGTPKELKELQNNTLIKHAVLGNVVDKY